MKIFLGFLFIVAIIIPITLTFVISKYTTSKLYLLGGFLSFIASFMIYAKVAEYIEERNEYHSAIENGFTTVKEYKRAKSLGFSSKEQYQKHITEIARINAENERLRIDKQRVQKLLDEQKKLKEEYEKIKAEEKKLEDEKNCKQDLKCLAEKNFSEATVYCSTTISKLAKYDFEWTDGWLEPKLSHYRWKNKEKGIITYIGDKAKFQNGFGAWQAHIYECDFDTQSKKVIDVRARPGRIQ